MPFTPNPVFEFLDGKSYTLNGISGVFAHETHRAIFPYPHTVERLNHEPDEEGRCSEAYRETRSELGDDWSTDLTNAIETYCEIALKMGYTFISEAE